MKKILILTVTAGSAHNACARSMKRELERMDATAEVKIVDLLKSYSTKRNVWVADGGYNFAVSKLPKLYSAFYFHYRKRKPYLRCSCPSQNTVLSTLNGLLQEILSFEPDVIFCTHFYGAIALTDLKLVYPLPCKTVVTSFDYVNSPFWESGIGVDYLGIPNDDFIETYLSLGYRREQLLPVGIPVDGRTLERLEKGEARKKLGLDENVFTVLVMFGGGHWSGGFRIFKDLIKALKGRRAQVIFINGKNEKSYNRVRKMKFEDGIKALNVGFTDDIPLYLSAADVAVNKCGGGSSTEILNQAVPMLVTEKIPAQEKCNLEYVKGKGVALSFRNEKELKAHILHFMDCPELLEQMSEKTLALRKNAMNDLAQFILAQPNADYGGFLETVLVYGDDLRAKKCVKRALREADKRERKRAKEGKRNKNSYVFEP